MSEFLISAYEWLVCLSEALVVFLLFKSKFACERSKLIVALALLPALATITTIMNILSIPWAIATSLNSLVYIIYVFFLFKGASAMKCIWGLVPMIIFCISNYVCVILFCVITDSKGTFLIPGNTVRIIGQLIYMALNFIILFPLMRIKSKDGELPAILRVGSIVAALIGIAVSMFCFSELVSKEANAVSVSDWLQCTAVLVLSICVLILSGYISRLYSKHLEAQRDLQKAKLEAEHVSQVSAMYDYVRGWRHDIKGMVSTVASLVDHGDRESIKEYLSEIGGAAEATTVLISTGNPAIDATISAKLMLAAQNGISVEHAISLPENMSINTSDLCSIIMNLMDNAIEAVSVLSSEQRRIEFSLIDKGGMLLISIKNPCKGEYKYDGERLATTKEDCSIHGIGLGRVNKIVSKHNGFIKVEPKEHSFEVNILMPLDKERVI